MNAQEIIAKADRGEGLTEEEIKVYRQAVKPVKHTYGKYGTLAKKYLEEENVGKYWAIENLLVSFFVLIRISHFPPFVKGFGAFSCKNIFYVTKAAIPRIRYGQATSIAKITTSPIK